MISTTCGALLFFVSFCQFFSVLITVVADFILSWLGNALPTKSVMTGQKSRDFAYIEVLVFERKRWYVEKTQLKIQKYPSTYTQMYHDYSFRLDSTVVIISSILPGGRNS